jgi:hypothetical protein
MDRILGLSLMFARCGDLFRGGVLKPAVSMVGDNGYPFDGLFF